MKKNLLFLGALMLTSVSASAQWVAPEMPAKASNLEDVVGEKVFLYNKEAGGFLRGLGKDGDGMYWGTRAGVDTTGIDTVIINKPFKSSVPEGTADIANIDETLYPYWMDESNWNNETFLIQAHKSHRNQKWDEIYFGLNAYDVIYLDRQDNVGGNTNFFFDVKKGANGYEISVSPKIPLLLHIEELAVQYNMVEYDEAGNATYTNLIKGGERMGVDLNDAMKRCYFEGHEGNLAYGWTIVKVADYEAADMEAFKAKVAQYNAALALKAAIDKGKAEYPAVDFSAAEAVYNNTSSTTEQLVAALELVSKAIIDYQENLATPDNPSDMTTAIVNPSFDVQGDFHGWLGTAFSAGGNASTNAEHYDKNYNTYQDIKGLPLGVYAVSVKGFYRAGWMEDDWRTKDDPSVRNATLYAVSGMDSLTTPILSLSSLAVTTSQGAPNESVITGEDGVTYYAPNSMADFTIYNEAGLIKDVTVVVPVSDGTLRIGVIKTKHIGADWTIVDDFTLKYYGNSQAAYDAWKAQVIVNYPSVDQIIPDDETLYSPSYLTAYENALAAAAAVADPAQMGAKIAAIQPTLDALYANIAAFKAYVAKAEEIQEAFLANAGLDAENDSVAYLADFFDDDSAPGEYYPNGGNQYIISGDADLTNDQLVAQTALLDEWLQSAIRNGISDGGDMTYMLKNPSFANGFDGWTTIGGNVGGADFCKNVEVYEGKVDTRQTVTGVPAGIYSISVQAFERPTGNGGYDGSEATKVYIFMNDIQTPVMNIAQDAISDDLAIDLENCYQENDYHYNENSWVPNGMTGASYAFKAGRYVNTCYGIVGEDGVMEIGITSNDQHVHWTLWANFQLTYEGKNVEAIQSILEATVEQALFFIEEKGGEMTTPAFDALNAAVAKAEGELETYEEYYAVLEEINAAMNDAKANIEAYEALIIAIDAMYLVYEENEATSTDEAFAKFVEVTEKIESTENLTTAELIALTDEVKAVTTMLRIPATDGASDANPVDMTGVIANADFSLGADNGDWTWEKTCSSGPNYGNAFDGPGFEFWDSNINNVNFDMYQVLSGLPAGKYTLTADLANSLNGQSMLDNGGRIYLYATTINGTQTKGYSSEPVEIQEEKATERYNTYEVTFTLAEGEKVQVGVKNVGTLAARWMVGDTFTLTYYGTNSSKEDSGDPSFIEGVENAETVAPVAIYSISGTRLAAPQKGINIVKMSDGTVKKVLVK